jgi:hypothetical protein
VAVQREGGFFFFLTLCCIYQIMPMAHLGMARVRPTSDDENEDDGFW